VAFDQAGRLKAADQASHRRLAHSLAFGQCRQPQGTRAQQQAQRRACCQADAIRGDQVTPQAEERIEGLGGLGGGGCAGCRRRVQGDIYIVTLCIFTMSHT
jgi:hypothetical protein